MKYVFIFESRLIDAAVWADCLALYDVTCIDV